MVTQDGKRTAQFEHTILVTETGYELLTARRDADGNPINAMIWTEEAVQRPPAAAAEPASES